MNSLTQSILSLYASTYKDNCNLQNINSFNQSCAEVTALFTSLALHERIIKAMEKFSIQSWEFICHYESDDEGGQYLMVSTRDVELMPSAKELAQSKASPGYEYSLYDEVYELGFRDFEPYRGETIIERIGTVNQDNKDNLLEKILTSEEKKLYAFLLSAIEKNKLDSEIQASCESEVTMKI